MLYNFFISTTIFKFLCTGLKAYAATYGTRKKHLMNIYLISIPFVSALTGWLLGHLIRSVLIKRIPSLIPKFIKSFASTILSSDGIHTMMSDARNLQTVLPLIENHIDEFLRHKLGKAMPMIGMFIGDKTIAELKAIFMAELEEIFPLVMEKYTQNLVNRFNTENFIGEKMAAIPRHKINSLVTPSLHTELRIIPPCIAAVGFITGLIQMVLFWWLY
jgi:uncharacterized membrane protein YheB (UPF0754 family)